VVGEDLVDVVPVLLADVLPQLGTDVAGVGEAGVAIDGLDRHHHVDAVGAAVDVLVDPLELQLELLGREGQRAEHPHATRVGHRGHDVATVAEGEDRVLDPEHLGQAVPHAGASSATARARR
jgi:hypothetical protein